eukprot:165074-Alexandrium_andersonii.AAC.1
MSCRSFGRHAESLADIHCRGPIGVSSGCVWGCLANFGESVRRVCRCSDPRERVATVPAAPSCLHSRKRPATRDPGLFLGMRPDPPER